MPASVSPPLDPTNLHFVAVQGDDILLLSCGRRMNRDQARNLIAYVAVLGFIEADQIAKDIEVVKST